MHRYLTLPAAIVVAACAPALAANSTPTAEEAKAIAEKMEVDTTLLASPGGADAETLRYAPSVGDTISYDTQYSVESTQKMGAQTMPSPAMPTIMFTFDAEVTEAGDDGFTLLTTVSKADAQVAEGDFMGAMTKSSVQSLVGTTINAPTSHRGFAPDVDIQTPDDADANAQAQIDSIRALTLTVPLPEEPIARGAVWHHKSESESNGVKAVTLATYTLRRTDDNNLYLTALTHQIITPGPVPADTMPPGATAEITEGAGTAEFTIIVDRATGVSHTLTCDFNLELALDINIQGNQLALEQSTSMTMESKRSGG